MESNVEILPEKGLGGENTANYPKNGENEFCNAFATQKKAVAEENQTGGNANSAAGAICAFCNAVPFEHHGEASGKYLIAPFGDFKNGEYIQRVDVAAAEKLKRNMGRVWNRIHNMFGNACPVYYEHPDDEDLKELPDNPDKTPYGKVRSLEILANGIYANIDWLPGFALLPRHLQISPRWNADDIAENVARPSRLVSLGLTRNPNIKQTSFVNHAGAWTPLKGQAPYGDCKSNAPIPNSECKQKEIHMDIEVLKLLGYSDEEAQKIINKAEDAPTDVLERLKKALSEKAALANEAEAKGKELEETKTALANSQEALKKSQTARASLIIANAVRAGKITEALRESSVRILANAEDMDAEAAKIDAQPPVVKTAPATNGIEKEEKRKVFDQQQAAAEIERLVAEKQSGGMDYRDAWNSLKAEKPELFEAAYPAEA